MATSRSVARSLRKSADRISKVRREIVADAGEYAIEQATSRGNQITLKARTYPMLAEVVSKKDTAKRSTIVVYPLPAGGWAIKSFGRGTSVGRPALSIDGIGVRRSAGPARGDGRWPDIQDDVEAEFPGVAGRLVDEALRG